MKDSALSEHDENCNCPGAQMARHKAERPKPADQILFPVWGCACAACEEIEHCDDPECIACIEGVGCFE